MDKEDLLWPSLLLEDLAQAFYLWIQYPHWALNWNFWESVLDTILFPVSPRFVTSFHYPNVGGYTFLLFLLRFTECCKIFGKVHERTKREISTLAYTASSSTHPAHTQVYAYVFDAKGLHLYLKALNLYFDEHFSWNLTKYTNADSDKLIICF